MLKFIHNYPSKRTIRTKIGNTLSESNNTTAGVSQGRVLSAICFIIAFNDILNPLPRGFKASLYADDLVIYHSSKRLGTLTGAIPNSIKRLEEKTLAMGLRISPTKSFWE